MSVRHGARTGDYDFELPRDRIAQTPAERRDQSRLMVVDRTSGTIEHRRFADVADYFAAGDALAVNTTRVLRARLVGTRETGGKAEVFLLKPLGDDRFEALVHPGGKLKPGRMVHVSPELDVEILEVTERRSRIVRLVSPLAADDAIERYGHIPLPPYIARGDEAADAERYQTVYADARGSVAAPTAGLHFTPELLSSLERAGVTRANLLLHVGAGTFKPVEVDDPAEHVMHEEWYRLDDAAARVLNAARSSGGRIWAVGTTSVRTLESAARADGSFEPASGDTRIFIRPPYEFRAVDKLITNFHLPRSTLIMLVAAFAGYDLTMRAYRTALEAGYRFYSYGDAMVVL
ncbi:MAG TPA: tRNA preQ1(34) S-adenosylmethionine ribosyltransferase-isomerase QueA [Gemmatimonadaceae bacterium]|nr:tRNA preQ1(34) S-adenosylmethionine ribosyltransferase-isomerase QueA [Gemmatimonadaceae bacterium]